MISAITANQELATPKLALFACDVGDPPHQDRFTVDEYDHTTGPLAAMLAGAPAPRGGVEVASGGDHAVAAAILLDRGGNTEWSAYAEVFGTEGHRAEPARRELTPWSMLDTSATLETHVPSTPAWADETAARVIAMADAIDREARDKSIADDHRVLPICAGARSSSIWKPSMAGRVAAIRACEGELCARSR